MRDYARGFYDAADEIMNWLNSLDSADMTNRELRAAMFRKAKDMRPRKAK